VTDDSVLLLFPYERRMSANDAPPVQSSGKLFRILERLVETGGEGVTALAEATGIPKSTVHLHLRSLQEAGYVVRAEQAYRPSLRLLELGDQTRQTHEVYRAGREEVDTLARETNELVNLGVPESGQVRLLYLREVEGDATHDPLSVSTEFEATKSRVSVLSESYEHVPGKALDMHATAMGKAILAELSTEEVDRIVDQHGLSRHTDRTITSRDRLIEELESIRNEGVAVDDECRVEGLCCVAAAVTLGGEPVAAVSISGLADRLNGEYRQQLANRVTNTAGVIEIKLAHS
jgi:DNA-binding IclR family transcriptional regulator